MNTEEFIELVKKCEEKEHKVLESKGTDYTQGNDDRLKNFKQFSEIGLTPLQAWYTYFAKHIDAIKTYILNNGQVESEPIQERILDARNYLLLLAGLIEENHAKTNFSLGPRKRKVKK